jgi:hypothetical protein
MEELKKTKTKKKGKLRRILKYLFILVVVLLALNIAPAFFYRPEVNINPLPPYYKKGVYHMHSVFSDGKGTVDEITDAAADLNLDFVILTDHGRPNIRSSTCTSWKDNVLLMGGTELSLNSGHLAAVGFKVPDYIFPPEPQESINEIIDEDGVCFISHPFDRKVPWTDWDIKRFTGLEVLSSYSEARKSGILKVLIFPLKYWINSKYALLNTMGYPVENVKKWDSLNADESHRYYGIYALDAHGKLPISKDMQLNFPTYKSMFEIMTVYVKVNSGFGRDAVQASSDIVWSLREGNFFNVIEGISAANGFEAYFKEKDTGKRIEMGGFSTSRTGTLVIHLPFKFVVDAYVLKFGRKHKEIKGIQGEILKINVKEPGVYRVEVYVPGNTFDELPWIMTNPFFIGVGEEVPLPSSPEKNEIMVKQSLMDVQDAFKVEKNSRSEGTIGFDMVKKKKVKITRFSFKLEKESLGDKDFWSVMSLRKRFDFSGYKGFVFEVRSDEKRRFWLEFRTKSGDDGEDETWYRHSFLADTEWKKFVISFNKFHAYFGEKDITHPQISKVNSVFISINNACAYEGAEGTLFLKAIGVY